jgi:hypothetical protein
MTRFPDNTGLTEPEIVSIPGSAIERPVSLALLRLYRQAFAEFGTLALWNVSPAEPPTPQHAIAVARQLRVEGNMAARRLAEEIEALARAAE